MQEPIRDPDNVELKQKELELAEREAGLAVREKELEVQEEKVKKGLKDNLYSKINLSLRTMDIVIGTVVAAIVILLVVGVIVSGG